MSDEPTRRTFLGHLGTLGLASWLGVELLAEETLQTSRIDAPAETARGILSLRLKASHLQSMARFYGESFGFEIEQEPGALRVQSGGTRIVFEEAEPGTAPYYHLAWAVPENKFYLGKEWVRRRTPILTTADGREDFDFRRSNRHGFFFADPAGNILEFVVRHHLRDTSPGPFQLADILYVNHAGLVVDAMDDAIDNIHSTLQLPLRGTPTAEFTSLGDEHRHLTLVRRGRLWLPDQRRPAEVHSADIVLHGPPSEELTLAGFPYRLRLAAPVSSNR